LSEVDEHYPTLTEMALSHESCSVSRRGGQLNQRLAADLIDVFVYVVVLDLFVEFFPGVISETFILSLLTAVLLKIVLELVLVIERRVRERLKQASTPVGKIAAASLLWGVLIGSKFAVLEIIDGLFGDRVSLGGFFSVALLILALVFARLGVRRLLRIAAPQADQINEG
jgi:hypothetical protein